MFSRSVALGAVEDSDSDEYYPPRSARSFVGSTGGCGRSERRGTPSVFASSSELALDGSEDAGTLSDAAAESRPVSRGSASTEQANAMYRQRIAVEHRDIDDVRRYMRRSKDPEGWRLVELAAQDYVAWLTAEPRSPEAIRHRQARDDGYSERVTQAGNSDAMREAREEALDALEGQIPLPSAPQPPSYEEATRPSSPVLRRRHGFSDLPMGSPHREVEHVMASASQRDERRGPEIAQPWRRGVLSRPRPSGSVADVQPLPSRESGAVRTRRLPVLSRSGTNDRTATREDQASQAQRPRQAARSRHVRTRSMLDRLRPRNWFTSTPARAISRATCRAPRRPRSPDRPRSHSSPARPPRAPSPPRPDWGAYLDRGRPRAQSPSRTERDAVLYPRRVPAPPPSSWRPMAEREWQANRRSGTRPSRHDDRHDQQT